MTITTKIGSAMATRLIEINESPTRLKERIDELTQQVQRQRDIIRDLRARLAQHEDETAAADAQPERITLQQAADKTGVNYFTAYRYIKDGWWQGLQDTNGHWWLDASQPLAKRPRKNAKSLR
jgi:uncharacterized coiled-coil protein SlyX